MNKCFTIANTEIVGWFTKERFKTIGKGIGTFLLVATVFATIVAAGVAPVIWLLNLLELDKLSGAALAIILTINAVYAIVAIYMIRVHTICKCLRIEEELLKLYDGYTVEWVSDIDYGYSTTVILHDYSSLEVEVREYPATKTITVYNGEL